MTDSEGKTWGTKALEEREQERSRFFGTVVSAEWTTGKKFQEDQDPREQVLLTIHPHWKDYEGEDLLSWFPYSESLNSKWGAFQRALEGCGVFPSSESQIVGLTFEWETSDLNFGHDKRRGVDLVAKRVRLPIKLAQPGEALLDGSAVPAFPASAAGIIRPVQAKAPATPKAPAQAQAPVAPGAPPAPAAPTPSGAPPATLDDRILFRVKDTPSTKDELAETLAEKKSSIVGAVSRLKKAGKVVEEDGVILLKE